MEDERMQRLHDTLEKLRPRGKVRSILVPVCVSVYLVPCAADLIQRLILLSSYLTPHPHTYNRNKDGRPGLQFRLWTQED